MQKNKQTSKISNKMLLNYFSTVYKTHTNYVNGWRSIVLNISIS